MKRKITAILLAFCVLMCFTSCDGTKTEVHIDNNIDNQIQQGDSDIDIQDPPTESEKPTQNIPKEEPTQNQEPVTNKPEPTLPSHTHSFSVATCTQAKTCSCGATSGTALGHNFSNATCTSPKVCSRCGATSGSALGHSYSAATCTTAKKCSRCGVTSGSALGHNYVNNKCSRCGKTDPNSLPVGLHKLYVIDSKHYTYKSSTFTDSFGNTYNGVHLFEDLYESNNGREPHAIFNLNGNYKRFTGSIVATPQTSTNKTYYIHIYVDDVLVFSKSGYTKTTGKIDFSVDVTNGEKLSVCMGSENTGGDYNMDIAIVNAQLTK